MEEIYHKTFNDVKIGDDIWVVVTEKDNTGTITNVECVVEQVIKIEPQVNRILIHLDNDILLVPEGEYGFSAKLWNNKVYCSDKFDAIEEIKFKLATTIILLRKKRFYIDDLIKKLETQYENI